MKPKPSKPTVLMKQPPSEAESDRRLRPALDSLYTRNWKQALKHLQQALHKRPGWPAARALRACALLQSGRPTEAEHEIETLHIDLQSARVPLDEDCARKMHLYYSEIRKEAQAAQVYENVWRKEGRLQLAETAFCLYIRGADWGSAQKLATRMHRVSGGGKYAFWAVAALWVSVVVGDADDRMLALARAMLKKVLDRSNSALTAEEVRFCVRVLEKEDGINLISAPGLVMNEMEVLHVRAQLGGEGDYKSILEKDAEDWISWLRLFEGGGNYMEFVEERALGGTRGAFLARLEGLARADSIELTGRIVEYFEKFGGKVVCAQDLRPYLAMAAEERLENVWDQMENIAEGKEVGFHVTLSWLRLWYERMEATPKELFLRYYALVSKDIETTDRQLGDDYLLMAAHKLLPDASDRYGDCAAVLQAIVLLEVGLSYSPFNYHFKLLLLKLYSEVGALGRVYELWASLEVKHVQLATLSYLVLRTFFEGGDHEILRDCLENIAALWRECDHEIPECVSKAFHVGSVNAAADFLLFQKRLQKSLVLAQAMVFEVFHEVVLTGGDPLGVQRGLQCLTVMPRFKANEVDGMLDSNDYRCMRFWEVKEYSPEERFECLNMEGEDEGVRCSDKDRVAVAADLQSLESLLKLAVANEALATEAGEESGEGNGVILQANGHNHNLSLEPATELRVKIAANLRDIKMLLGTRQVSDSENGITVLAEETVQSAQEVTGTIDAHVKSVIGSVVADLNGKKSGNGTTEGHIGGTNFSPARLRRCGRVVFDTLIMTCVAIVSFSSDLMRSRKKSKKATAKAESNGGDFECARRAVLTYKDSVLKACELIHEWITSCLEKDLDWAGSVFPEGDEMSDRLSYLPDVITQVDITNEGDKGDDLKRAEVCEVVLAQICASHAQSCRSILETLRAITSRLKMVDL